MKFKLRNGSKAGLIAIAFIFSASGLAYLSLAGSNFINNQFSETSVFYGKNVFKDTREQCQFIESRLADVNLKNPNFIDKYTKDKESLKCVELETIHESAPEITHDQLGYFLHEASSGQSVVTGTNNLMLYILNKMTGVTSTIAPNYDDTTTSAN